MVYWGFLSQKSMRKSWGELEASLKEAIRLQRELPSTELVTLDPPLVFLCRKCHEEVYAQASYKGYLYLSKPHPCITIMPNDLASEHDLEIENSLKTAVRNAHNGKLRS